MLAQSLYQVPIPYSCRVKGVLLREPVPYIILPFLTYCNVATAPPVDLHHS